MDRAHGRAPEDDPPYTMLGWVADLAPAERARLSAEAIRTMARIHTVDVEACGLQGLDRQQPGETLLDRELAHFVEWLEWGREGEPNEVVDAAFDWVRQNRPAAEGRLALSWGDSRIGNMLFDEDLRCTVVLDWEFATLAAPELDLGWWLFMQAHFTDALGVPLPGPGAAEIAQSFDCWGLLVDEPETATFARDVPLIRTRAALRVLMASALAVRAGRAHDRVRIW